MNGLYRRASGGEIVKSFYDFDTKKIGPFELPIDLYYDIELSQGDTIDEGCMYKVLLEREDMLAVFNLNNFCLMCVTPNLMYELNKDGTFNGDLPEFPLLQPIEVPHLDHIGYIKTYQQNLSVSTLPFYLFKTKDNVVDGTSEFLTHTPLLNPPIQLYKQLVNTSEEVWGVYYDTTAIKPVFIDKRGKEVLTHV